MGGIQAGIAGPAIHDRRPTHGRMADRAVMTLETAAALVGIATAILGGLLWLIRAQVSMLKEFKPNGGASARDQWNRTEADVREIRRRLDDHIDNHHRP
jgi:hypothetical protein